MKKWLFSFITAIVLSGVIQSSVEAVTPNDVKLTNEQKKELAELHEDIFEDKKELIKKYVEFGVLTEEDGKKMIFYIEKKHKKLKENDYIPHPMKKDDHH